MTAIWYASPERLAMNGFRRNPALDSWREYAWPSHKW
jgi:hypothetical protein